MNKLRDRLHTGIGLVTMGGMLTAALGVAVVDRISHPVDTYRDIRKRRAGTRSRCSQELSPPSDAINPDTINPDTINPDTINGAMSAMDARQVDLYSRQIREGGAKIAEFLIAHPEIDPEFIEDMSENQQAELTEYLSDFAITQQIERNELDIGQ